MRRRLFLLAALVVAAFAMSDASALADTNQISIMQDDQYLVDSGTASTFATLGKMQRLGVQEVRVNLEWADVAPDPTQTSVPTGFDAVNPADYGQDGANWAPYVTLADAAPLFGISVQFNLTSPGPLWAMGTGAPDAKTATHWEPNAAAYYDFVYAAGEEFSGNVPDVTRVSDWSIWNEPNQPGWLAPQWQSVDSKTIPESAVIYRGLVNDGYYALAFSGHTTSTDTVLIGETAPEGDNGGSATSSSTPLAFLRTLYCVNARQRPLRGTAATAAGCPTGGKYSDFVHANAALFDATGYSHHPYDFLKTPTYSWTSEPNYAPLSDISRLETFLNQTFTVYGVHRKIPLYFTEYGYETNPPDPHKPVSPAQQADYLNEADYISWKNPRVKSVAQFLLYDSAPNLDYQPDQYDYWDTFQSGLLYLGGKAKPAYAAYRMPIWLPQTHVKAPGTQVLVWGQVRPADTQSSQTVTIQWSAGHTAWTTIGSAHTKAKTGYYTVHVHLPGSGYVRAAWSGTVGTAANAANGSFSSRKVAVVVK
jgi:hypothetical protein